MVSGNDLTKLARWIIPGWLGILAFYVFIAIDILFTPPYQARIYPSISSFFESMTAMNAALTTFIVAASGIPLGFLIYQAYFFFRWNSPFSRDGLLPPLITGRMNDLDQVLREDISYPKLVNSILWRKNWVEDPFFKQDHGFRWRYIELFFTEAIQRIDSKYEGFSLSNRHRYLHEIMHTLGASIGAVYLGFLGYLLVMNSRREGFLLSYLLVVVLMVLVMFFLLNRENQSKVRTNDSGIQVTPHAEDPIPAINIKIGSVNFFICSPGSLYVFSLFLIHLFGNPLLRSVTTLHGASFEIVIRIILSATLISLWVMSKSKSSIEFKLGDLFWLGSAFLSAVIISLLPISLTSWIDWPFFTVMFVFLTLNLILFQNRYNVVQDMLAMEYYSIQRVIEDNDPPMFSEKR